jgi:hypothetical protein
MYANTYTDMYMNLDDTMYPIPEYTEDQQQPVAQQNHAWMYNPTVPGT